MIQEIMTIYGSIQKRLELYELPQSDLVHNYFDTCKMWTRYLEFAPVLSNTLHRKH